MIGMVLGQRYELEEVVGQGGMAHVYRARDRVLGRPVAVKVLRPEYSNDEVFVARFQREARAAANLVHPNVVAVYDVGQDGDYYYIVMEYVPGPTLKDVIRERAPLTVEFALQVAEQVCAALEYAHRQGVIHRDIKPQNILLREDEETAKVADFGIARSRLDPESTAERLALGTVKYVSPEQARGVEVVPQSDLYSLGVVLYEMLTGQQPFDGDTPLNIALQHIEAEVVPPRRLNLYLPPAVEGIILRAMSKDPRDRFSTAREMRQALGRYRLAGAEVTGPIPTAPVESPPRVSPVASRRIPPPPKETGLGFLGIVLLVLIAAGIVALVVLVRPLLFPSGAVSPSPSATSGGPTPEGTVPIGPTVPPTDTPPTTLPSQVPAPDLVGLSEQEARERLEQFGLRLVKGEGGCDPYIDAGYVMAQEPPFGTYLSPGDAVTVSLGMSSGLARVPPVLQMSYEGAKLKLEGACFRVVRVDVGCTGTPAGRVHRQDPLGGFQEMQRYTVTLYVSAGDDATMPELLRVPLGEARQRVEEAGLTWGYPNPQTQADMPPGVNINNLGAPGEVISYVVTYNGTRRTSGNLKAGDQVPCGARVDVAYNATQP